MKNAPQFRRGQVWYVDDNYVPIGSIQGKSRPYLVVSNDACNRFSPVIHMAPITSQMKKLSQPTHVQFFNPRRKQNNWILLEQAMPKSVPDIADISDYQYTLSADVMQEVDKALAIQFALKSFGVDISDFETMLDMIVEQKIAQIQDATQSLLDARMAKYVEGLLNRVTDAAKLPDPQVYVPNPVVLQKMQYAPEEALPEQDQSVANPVPKITIPADVEIKMPIPPEVKQVLDDDEKSHQSQIDKFNAKWGTQSPAPKQTDPKATQVQRVEITRTQSGRIRWTSELKQQFLDDMASYGPKKVAGLYDLDEKCLQAYRYKFNHELGVRTSTPTKTRSSRKSRGSREFDAPKSQMLQDYDEMPISKFMEKYGIATRSEAVEIAAKLRIG